MSSEGIETNDDDAVDVTDVGIGDKNFDKNLNVKAECCRREAERKAHEMAVLVADLQKMRTQTARNAVSRHHTENPPSLLEFL